MEKYKRMGRRRAEEKTKRREEQTERRGKGREGHEKRKRGGHSLSFNFTVKHSVTPSGFCNRGE